MNRVVIDASVVLKWYLSDEEYGDIALKIMEDHVSERLSLHAPAILEFEVANALVIARRQGRIKDADVLMAMDGFAGLGIGLSPLASFYEKVFLYCKRFRISAYDASYIALADKMNAPLITADKRLFNATRKVGFVQWIGAFQ